MEKHFGDIKVRNFAPRNAKRKIEKFIVEIMRETIPTERRKKMTDKQRKFAVSESLNYTDEDAFVSDIALSSEFDGAEITDELINELKELWQIAHMSIADIRKKSGLSRVAFCDKLLIPIRTAENWESDKSLRREPPLYVKFLIYYYLNK